MLASNRQQIWKCLLHSGMKNLGALEKVTSVKHRSKADVYTNLYVIEFEKAK